MSIWKKLFGSKESEPAKPVSNTSRQREGYLIRYTNDPALGVGTYSYFDPSTMKLITTPQVGVLVTEAAARVMTEKLNAAKMGGITEVITLERAIREHR